MTEIFEMAPGDVRMISSFGSILIVRLDAINPATEDPDALRETEALSAEMGQLLGAELFNLFGQDVVLRSNPQINQQALDAVHTQMP
ncbi:MAG: peptidylprolyl isomerase, partial [Pseudomonadota bacterium]